MTVPTYGERVQAARRMCQEVFTRMDNGEEVDFEELRGQPGVALEPITWEQLKEIIATGTEESLGSQGRHPLGIKRYFEQREKKGKMFASIADSLMVEVYNLPTKLNEEGKLVAIVPEDFTQELRVEWVPNVFPYFYEEGMEHANVWANRALTTEELEQFIAKHCQGWEVQYWVNPPALLSVPGVWHAHVIRRRKP